MPFVIRKSGFFSTVLVFLLCCIFVFTSSFLYDVAFGFELLIISILLSCILSVPFFLGQKIDKVYLILLALYLLVCFFSLLKNFDSLAHSLIYLVLFIFFLLFLPTLNDRAITLLKIISNFNVLFFIITVSFIILNIGLYAKGYFFINKDKYFNLLSNPNLAGYIVYLGFSFSFMLYSVTSSRKYFLYLMFYLIALIFIPPVLTAYVSVFLYIVLVLFFALNKLLKLMFAVLAITAFTLGILYFIENFEELKILLSYRDVLFTSSVEKIAAKPFLGYGIEGWGYLFLNMKNPHNFILYQLLSFGFLGALLFVSIFLFVIYRAFDKYSCHKSILHLHVFLQLVVNLMVMSVFVAMPGNYQDISIMMSVVLSLLINASLKVNDFQTSKNIL